MGHFVFGRPLAFGGNIESDHVAGHDAEALVLAIFEAAVEQQLQAEADAEERFAGGDGRADRLDEVARFEGGNGVAKGADAGEHELRCFGQLGRVVGDRRRVPRALERLLDAAEVAHAVVDDGDHGEVEGPGLRVESQTRAGSRVFARQRDCIS